MSVEVLLEQKRKIERKINRNKVKIKDHENRLEKLSEHGHWMLGYLLGMNAAYENMLDAIDDMIIEINKNIR